jgi:hypothetical protein
MMTLALRKEFACSQSDCWTCTQEGSSFFLWGEACWAFFFSLCSDHVPIVLSHVFNLFPKDIPNNTTLFIAYGFAQSSFLLLYRGGPNRRHYIFTWKLLFWGPSIVSKIFFFSFFFFLHDGPMKMAHWTQKRKIKRKGIWETPPIYLIKFMVLCCVLY